jgi:hypothetical protein
MPSASAGPFVMLGTRDAMAGGLNHVEQHVKSIEQAVAENPGLAFDLAKTLVETVCRTVLSERDIAFSEDDSLPKLFKIATMHLPFLPPTASREAEARESLRRTLGGLSTAIQGICELRNHCGFASHGAGAPRPAMEGVQAVLAAQAADTIVGFLHRVHRQDMGSQHSRPALYLDNPTFNDYVDEAHAVIQIFDVEFRPSEVLFQMEPETYRVYLAELDLEGGTGNPDAIAPLDEPAQPTP